MQKSHLSNHLFYHWLIISQFYLTICDCRITATSAHCLFVCFCLFEGCLSRTKSHSLNIFLAATDFIMLQASSELSRDTTTSCWRFSEKRALGIFGNEYTAQGEAFTNCELNMITNSLFQIKLFSDF
jgi:hypothetical protein